MADYEKRVVHTLGGDGVPPGRFMFFCPGCECGHWFQTQGSPAWTFNGDMERPTVSPSILVRGTVPMSDEEYERLTRGEKIDPRDFVCHSFVTDGRIQFLTDSTHALSGQTVPLEPF